MEDFVDLSKQRKVLDGQYSITLQGSDCGIVIQTPHDQIPVPDNLDPSSIVVSSCKGDQTRPCRPHYV
jgi:hypothetical protein